MNSFSHPIKLAILLCLLAAVSVAEGQSDQIPGEIAGYRVLATYNSEDVACRRPNVTQIILQATQPTVEAFLAEVNSAAVLEALRQIPSSRIFRVEFVGPSAGQARTLDGLQRWNEVHQGRPCMRLSPLSEGSSGDELTRSSPSNGYVVFENVDAGSYSNDNAQSVFLGGPTTIGSGAALLNNVKTNSGYFLQNGFIFTGGTGFIAWTSDSEGLDPVIYDTNEIDYDGTHEYWFTITYTSNVWQLCAQDMTTSDYSCVLEYDATGTTLAGIIDTAVWLENQNTASNWYSGFSGTWYAREADIYLNGAYQDWSSDHLHTIHACGSPPLYPTSNAMSGSLANYGTGTFTLSGVPLRC